MFTDGTVTVVTAATGHRNLFQCIASVQSQSYAPIEHLIVIDGPDHESKVRDRVAQCNGASAKKAIKTITIPHATGRNNWNGHRIYAAASFLVNSEFIAFLDEDNWYDPEHVESLIDSMNSSSSPWAFSLRKIVDCDGNIVALDNCESLGGLHHAVNSPQNFLVDTSCYVLRRELAVEHAPLWYCPTRCGDVRNEPDGALCRALLKEYPQFGCNRRHTLNYSVGNRADSVQAEFFIRGNQCMQQKYPDGLPWEAAASHV